LFINYVVDCCAISALLNIKKDKEGMFFYNKYRYFLLIVILLIWILFTASHFQKGGVHPKFYFVIAVFVASISMLINFSFDKFHLFERGIAALCFAFISLFISTLLIGPLFVEIFYGDRTWFFWETKHRIFINTFYYGLNAIILIILAKSYFKIRTQIREKNKLRFG
jgi:hypothetical protein